MTEVSFFPIPDLMFFRKAKHLTETIDLHYPDIPVTDYQKF